MNKIEDIQSWWEVPSIAYFCSLFRTAFNLLDFDIEELEEALLTDGTEESASSLLTELIVRLLNGCLGNNDVSAFNYQMYLRRLFRQKCQETGRYNPFNTDIDFQFLPLRTKVEILYALCDFRLDAEDVFDLFKNLEAESLRVEPLGWDQNNSAYWYFYGTRLYREDKVKKSKGKKKKKGKESKKRGGPNGEEWLDETDTERVWQVVCFTEEDWTHLTDKFSKATSRVEKELYRSLSQNFLPEIPRLFQEKERLQRKRLLELAPRRTSSRVLQKIKQKEEENKPSESESKETEDDDSKDERKAFLARENRAKRRNLIRTKSESSDSSDNSSSDSEMPQKPAKKSRGQDKRSKNSNATHKGEPPPEPPVKTGRKTNNSLASATGQILIPDTEEPVNSTRKKLKTSQIFSQTEEDVQTDMYKVLEQLTAHEDAWPFMDPVEEEYAPNYYAVIRRPMDLHKMEERLDTGHYTDFSMFKADFKLIVNNCRLYNGQDNEYTMMVDNLQAAFDRLTEKYIHRLSSSDEEIAVEYQIPTPSRKHKLKITESPTNHKRKKRKSHSESGEGKSSFDDTHEEKADQSTSKEVSAESHHKSKDGKIKKKHKGHHRHGKHSKNHKKEHKGSKHSKKQKHGRDKEGKKSKQKRKKNKHVEEEAESKEVGKRASSPESAESSMRSRSASPLPSIRSASPTPSPEPPPSPPPPPPSPPPDDFYKDKYDKIKERRRTAAKDAWESLFDYKQKTIDKQKQNIHVPEKEKNQKLRETIEKLKAKNEKYKDTAIFNSLFPTGNANEKQRNTKKSAKESARKAKEREEPDFTDDSSDSIEEKVRSKNKKGHKKASAKNESASEALEQAVKDISKWLEEAPKGSSGSSPCDSPAQTLSTEEQDSRLDDELERTLHSASAATTSKGSARKRPSSREPKTIKRREIQRTIDRLQPGKSKGNLLTSKNVEKVEEVVAGPSTKVRDSYKFDEAKSSPRLSLGSVLATVEFTLGKDHNFVNNDDPKEESNKEVTETVATDKEVSKEETDVDEKSSKTVEPIAETKQPEEPAEEPEPVPIMKPNQEKATPNLSAWFKAFGAPKSTPTTTSAPPKKKSEEVEPEEKLSIESKPVSPKPESPRSPGTPRGGDSPVPPRPRRPSTASSVSERSSFSQDLDSPRHQMSHSSPLLRSPASPRDDFQKITYPIINGTVRAGFYQDTTSVKSSPEKSCSPREGPHSPYSPSYHVYASNNNAAAHTPPNYFVDHNKSPLPIYGTNHPPYYDAAKLTNTTPAAVVTSAAGASAMGSRAHEEYTSLAGEYAHPGGGGVGGLAGLSGDNYGTLPRASPPLAPPAHQHLPDPKTSLFPVKKRAYNEVDQTTKKSEQKEIMGAALPNDYQKIVQTMQSLATLPNTSVDDITASLNEKSDASRKNSRDRITSEYGERIGNEIRENLPYINTAAAKKEITNVATKKHLALGKGDNIDMVNMGYMNPEMERRSSAEAVAHAHELDYSMHKSHALPKGYEIDAIAMNLGISSQNLQRALKPSSGATPAAAHSNNEYPAVSHAAHPAHSAHSAHSTQPTHANFSLNDIELANKKLYGNSAPAPPTSSILDYGNWKLPNQMRKDLTPSDYSTSYADPNKHKQHELSAHSQATVTTAAASNNYNKNMQHQQYHNYNVPRTSNTQRIQDVQQNLPSELRIPNPRNLVKGDHGNSRSEHLNIPVSSMNSSDMLQKNMEASAKSQKSDKHIQNHPLVGSLQYKTPYSTHSSLQLESLRNIPNIPQMLERYSSDERYLSSFAASGSLYHDKTFQMAQMSQMFQKSMASEAHTTHAPSVSVGVYSQSQPALTITKDTNMYKTSPNVQNMQPEKAKTKRKRTSETKQPQPMSSQSYHASDAMKTGSGVMSSGAFNFASAPNISLGGGLYSDNAGFSIEDFRNSTNQLMAANYMAAAVAHQQRTSADAEKLAKPAHASSNHAASSSFPFMGHGAARGYAFPGSGAAGDYQQYLQRHQEELLRQTGAVMGLYPAGYPAALAARQPYDAINRQSWL